MKFVKILTLIGIHHSGTDQSRSFPQRQCGGEMRASLRDAGYRMRDRVGARWARLGRIGCGSALSRPRDSPSKPLPKIM